jgi:LPXTG-site transpeptidase (sortase) family protein
MRRPLFLAGYLIAMAVVGFLVFLVVPRVFVRPTTRVTPTPVALVVTPTAAPSATAAPTATPLPMSSFPPSRLVIEKLGVNAPWQPLGYLADGLTMDSPPGPNDLGWYKFTDEPGGESNAVFSGHVDWFTGAPAIFRGIASLKEGDEIKVSRADGHLRTYKVVSTSKPDQFADATPIIAPSDAPTVTLITCVGDWNPVTHEYSNRLVVVAQAPK